MIKEAYVSFEVAKLLKEKGFVESCYGRYSIRSKEFHLDTTKPCNNGSNFLYCAPTHQMAMAWLREVCNVYMDIAPTHITNGAIQFIWQTYDSDYSVTGDCKMSYDSYEEAVEAALKYCLENLI